MKKLIPIIIILLITFLILLIAIYNLDEKKEADNSNTSQVENSNNQVLSQVELSKEYDDTVRQNISTYFSEFKEYLNSNKLSQKIDSEYFKNKFKNENEFNQYVQENKEQWINAKISTYEIFYGSDYIDYICKDTNQNYYIFREKNNDYTIILDIYTMDLQWLADNYDKADDNDKVKFIVEKIVNMINCNDYEAIYEKLSENFKKSHFNTFLKFEEYAKNNFKKGSSFDIEYDELLSDNTNVFDLILSKNIQGESYIYTNFTTIIKVQNINNYIIAFDI